MMKKIIKLCCKRRFSSHITVKKRKYSEGFSLLELLVSFGIISVLTGVSLMAFSNYNEIQQMSQTAINIELMVSQARSNAQSIVKKVSTQDGSVLDCTASGTILESYKIRLENNSAPARDSIKLEMICNPALSPTNVVKSLEIPTGIDISTSSCMEFEVKSLPETPIFITPCDIVLRRGSSTKTIHVDNNGNTSIL